MRGAALAALLALGCTPITGDFSDVVQVELLTASPVRLEEGQSVTLEARALDIDGNILPEAPITWEILPRDTFPVGITLDPASGLLSALAPGIAAVRARVENLPTDPLEVRVDPAADSLTATDTILTVAATETQSALLLVSVLDLTSAPEMPRPLTGRTVTFRITVPDFAGVAPSVELVAAAVSEDGLSADIVSTPQGAGTIVRRAGPVQPDSVVVEATAATALGAVVPGSPVRFVVHFASE